MRDFVKPMLFAYLVLVFAFAVTAPIVFLAPRWVFWVLLPFMPLITAVAFAVVDKLTKGKL